MDLDDAQEDVAQEEYEPLPLSEDEDEPETRPEGQTEPGKSSSGTRGKAEKEAEPEEPEEVEEPKAQPNEYNALAARHRILERDHQVMAKRFEQLLGAISGASQARQEPSQEELPDPEEDGLGAHIVARLKRMEDQAEADRVARDAVQQNQALANEYSSARGAMMAYRAQDPATYEAAVTHLANVTFEEARAEMPGYTDQDIALFLQRAVVQYQLKWQREGRNPGEELVKMAMRRGFRIPERAAPAEDARQTVEAAKAKEQKARTISGVPGASPRGPLKLARALEMPEDTWQVELKKIPLRDLLKGKGRS